MTYLGQSVTACLHGTHPKPCTALLNIKSSYTSQHITGKIIQQNHWDRCIQWHVETVTPFPWANTVTNGSAQAQRRLSALWDPFPWTDPSLSGPGSELFTCLTECPVDRRRVPAPGARRRHWVQMDQSPAPRKSPLAKSSKSVNSGGCHPYLRNVSAFLVNFHLNRWRYSHVTSFLANHTAMFLGPWACGSECCSSNSNAPDISQKAS